MSIHRRLNVIADLIQRKKYRELDEEAESLSFYSDNENHQELFRLIASAQYADALHLCTTLIQNEKLPADENSLDLTGLITVLRMLETQWMVLSHQKAEVDRTITQFRVKYNQELGMLIGDLLREKIRFLNSLRDTNPDMEYESKKAKEDWESYQKTWDHTPKKNIPDLSKADREKIIKAYRKASKLCHPDMVAPAHRSDAAKVFIELNRAYYYNELSRVEELLTQIENGIFGFGTSEEISEASMVRAKISKIRNDVDTIRSEIGAIYESETWRTINAIKDWDIFFGETRQKLEDELRNYREKEG